MSLKIEFKSYGVDDMPLSRQMYEQAYDKGMSLSQLMEYLNPTEPGDTTGLDAFERQLRRFGIQSQADTRFATPNPNPNPNPKINLLILIKVTIVYLLYLL